MGKEGKYMREVIFKIHISGGIFEVDQKGYFHKFAEFDEVDGSRINVAIIEHRDGAVHEIPLADFRFCKK